MVFDLTRPGIEPESTVSVAHALCTPPLLLVYCREVVTKGKTPALHLHQSPQLDVSQMQNTFS